MASVLLLLRPALHDASAHSLRRTFSTSSVHHSASTTKSHLIAPSTSFIPPRGYAVSGVHAGVKSSSPPSKLDVAIVISDRPASAAACFTRNAFQAAPVHVSRDVLRQGNGKARAIAINSGCANAVTGKQGLEDAWAMSRKVDELLSQGSAGEVGKREGATGTLVMSTGVIGQLLPIRRILSGISAAHWSLGSSYDAWNGVASAFMTTDTFPKLRSRSFQLGGKEVRFAGIDKGAGMIHPNMGPPHATLLGLIATDAAIDPSSLQNALTYAVNRSFNSISVDGDMSTNDTIVVLANGASGAKEISEKGDPEEFGRFRDELTSFAQELAQLIVRDGEGATKFVKVDVRNAPSYEGAHRIASTISTSSLVKCALHGEDANWGRILCAIGYTSPLDFAVVPEKVSVSFIPSDGSEELRLLVNGEPEKVDEDRAKEILSVEDLEIRVDLGLGAESAQYWTCDLSKEYISINADYRS